MMNWSALIGTAVNVVLGWFGYSKAVDPSVAAEQMGEKLGKTESGEANADAGLQEIDTAEKARDRVDGDLAAHPDRVRAPDGDAVPRGADGVS